MEIIGISLIILNIISMIIFYYMFFICKYIPKWHKPIAISLYLLLCGYIYYYFIAEMGIAGLIMMAIATPFMFFAFILVYYNLTKI